MADILKSECQCHPQPGRERESFLCLNTTISSCFVLAGPGQRTERQRDRMSRSPQPPQHLQDFIDLTINGLISDGLEDAKSRCIESCENEREIFINQLKVEISSAREEVEEAQLSLLRKKENLRNLKSKLESESIKLVSNLKSTREVESESFRKCLNEVLVFILYRGRYKVWR